MRMNSKATSFSPTVSVIVIVFNQVFSKLIKTLDSIIKQDGISFEIIICDDGSTNQYGDELRRYFSLKSFYDYTLVFHTINEGTVSNYLSGLEIARGKYSKLISPGDCLTERHTLRDWINYLRNNNAEWSFSDAYYYRVDDEKVNYFKASAKPQILRPYFVNDRAVCVWNYLALKDVANGAAIIGKTHIQMHFCKIINEYGMMYSEDSIYRLMMFHGIIGCYYPVSAICYEYGTGISTSGDEKWGERLAEDRKKLIQIMLDANNKSDQQERIIKAFIYNSKPGKFRKVCIRGRVKLWLKCHFNPRLTQLPEEKIEQS